MARADREDGMEGTDDGLFWEGLAELLDDPECFAELHRYNRSELLRAVRALEVNHPHYSVVERFAAAIADPSLGAEYGPGLAALLHCRVECDEAVDAILLELVARARASGDLRRLAGALGDYMRWGWGWGRADANLERLSLCRSRLRRRRPGRVPVLQVILRMDRRRRRPGRARRPA